MFVDLDNFKKRIELSLCEHFASKNEVKEFCNKAKKVGVGVVCVNPINIPLVVQYLKGTNIEISANIGFPFGSHYKEFKKYEAERAIKEGATQIDMVINVGAIRSGDDKTTFDEIKNIVDIADGRTVKVIIETWVLNNEEKVRASKIARDAGANIIKTTTGVRTQYLKKFHDKQPIGSTIEDIKLIRKTIGSKMKIKASGGIYTLDFALKLIGSGADQLGVSRGYDLIEEFRNRYKDGIEIHVN